jgi:iduronate 2-sulfatase
MPPGPPAPRPPPNAKNDTRPSILLIHVDSMDGRQIEEGSAALTPNLDKLAARGVKFSMTYTAAPECVPSRSSVWSGRRNDQVMPIALDVVQSN